MCVVKDMYHWMLDVFVCDNICGDTKTRAKSPLEREDNPEIDTSIYYILKGHNNTSH